VRVGIVCVWQGREKKTPATEIEVSPHRNRPNRGAETGETWLREGEGGLRGGGEMW